MDFEAIKQAAQGYLPQMTKFLRDLIAIPSESCDEEGVIRRTIAEMKALGFDKAEIDPEGNALGWMGRGRRVSHYPQRRQGVEVFRHQQIYPVFLHRRKEFQSRIKKGNDYGF